MKDCLVVYNRTLDVGAVQKDSLHSDPLKSLKAYYETIHLNYNYLEESEAKFLHSHGVGAVLVDATPIACSAAKKAGSSNNHFEIKIAT